MKIKNMKFDAKTYISPELEEIFRNLPIVQVVFALNDDLLVLHNNTFCYAKDKNISFYENLAIKELTDGKIEKIDTLEFVKKYIIGLKTPHFFRLSTLMLNYYHTHYKDKSAAWELEFVKKYGIKPPLYNTPQKINRLKMIVANHNDDNNRFIMAHFTKQHGINAYLLRDMIFRKFLVADNNRNACFPIYDNFVEKSNIVGMHYKSIRYNNKAVEYDAPESNDVYCYVPKKYENQRIFTYLHIFSSPLELMKYATLLKDKIIKYERGSSHLFAVLPVPNTALLSNLFEKYQFENVKCYGKTVAWEKSIGSTEQESETLF